MTIRRMHEGGMDNFFVFCRMASVWTALLRNGTDVWMREEAGLFGAGKT
jgi:hypothetical protein